jgi:hypothetical protein
MTQEGCLRGLSWWGAEVLLERLDITIRVPPSLDYYTFACSEEFSAPVLAPLYASVWRFGDSMQICCLASLSRSFPTQYFVLQWSIAYRPPVPLAIDCQQVSCIEGQIASRLC